MLCQLIVGCVVVMYVYQQAIVRNSGNGEKVGWAFGLGLERLAMVLFDIPDIRLFWTKDDRFLSQFSCAYLTQISDTHNIQPQTWGSSLSTRHFFKSKRVNQIIWFCACFHISN